MANPDRDPLHTYGERLLEAVHRRKVRRLFIDGLTTFQNATCDPSRIGNFFSALANELRGLGVTTVYSLEVPDILGTSIRVPLDDVSSLAENMILLRFVEQRSWLHRLISILKVRDSNFDSSLYEFVLTNRGVEIEEVLEDEGHRVVVASNGRQALQLAAKDPPAALWSAKIAGGLVAEWRVYEDTGANRALLCILD